MTHHPDPRPTLGLAALLAFLSMLSPFSLDTFFPSFPAIAQEFSLSALQLQQTLTAYLVPYGLTMLLHGPLSDAYGRRRTILVGVSLYTVASIACASAQGFGALLVFRALQGATAGAGMVVARAVVRDLYSGHEAQRLMSLITMLFGFAPAVAPVIGGWVHVAFGWRAVFVFLVLLGLATVLISWWRLPETHPPERRFAFQFGTLISLSWRIVSHREFLLLEYLMRHAGQVVTRTMLLENVWEYHFDPQTNVIDVHISRLRSKIDKGYVEPLLHTVRGAGYSLRAAS